MTIETDFGAEAVHKRSILMRLRHKWLMVGMVGFHPPALLVFLSPYRISWAGDDAEILAEPAPGEVVDVTRHCGVRDCFYDGILKVREFGPNEALRVIAFVG